MLCCVCMNVPGTHTVVLAHYWLFTQTETNQKFLMSYYEDLKVRITFIIIIDVHDMDMDVDRWWILFR